MHTKGRRSNVAGGLLLIALGLVFLAGSLGYLPENWGALVPGAIGIVLMVSAAFGQGGLLLPGALLTSFGAVIYINAAGLMDMEQWRPLWILAPGVGFLLAALLSPRQLAWAVYPGLMVTLVGAGLLALSFGMAEWVGKLWPVLLVLLGVRLLISRRRPVDQPQAGPGDAVVSQGGSTGTDGDARPPGGEAGSGV